MSRKTANRKQTVAIVGAGSLATFLAPALADAGYTIAEIIARDRPQSLACARALARKVKARTATIEDAALDVGLIWFCVPDREIRPVAAALARRTTEVAARRASASRGPSATRFAFHSSGALLSRELRSLGEIGFAIASVHPLMTFVPGARPSLAGVPFAMEGDTAAIELARRVVRDFGGQSFTMPARRKAAYHAWATMTSPLLLVYLVTLEDAARKAGLAREDARRMSLPIILQTLENYHSLGPRRSFSGPFIRGDAATVAKHLALLKSYPRTYAVYAVLARAALDRLPVKNRRELLRLIESTGATSVGRKAKAEPKY